MLGLASRVPDQARDTTGCHTHMKQYPSEPPNATPRSVDSPMLPASASFHAGDFASSK